VHVLAFAIELDQFALEVRAYRLHDLLGAGQVPVAEHLVSELGDEDQVGVEGKDTVPARSGAVQIPS
jgi:hypothetical protein